MLHGFSFRFASGLAPIDRLRRGVRFVNQGGGGVGLAPLGRFERATDSTLAVLEGVRRDLGQNWMKDPH